MGLAGIAYLFLCVYCSIQGYPSGDEFRAMSAAAKEGLKAGPCLCHGLFFLGAVLHALHFFACGGRGKGFFGGYENDERENHGGHGSPRW